MKTSPDLRSVEDQGSAVRTFLIADIRGYSTYTRERGHEEAAKLAARFVDLAQDAVEARGGRIVEVRGDEVLAVFASPVAAVHAGVDLQLACTEESVSEAARAVPAGVGIDQGESVREGVHYHGSALNLAARLCSVASAGEVLVTKAVGELCSNLQDLKLQDRGPSHFKGFETQVDVVAISSSRAPTPQPAVLEGSSLPGELETLTPMVGRDRELHWLRGIWRQVQRGQGRVVFVSGPHGIGKTRLAAALAEQVPFLGGYVFYAGSGGTATADARQALRAALTAARPVLLVLDDLDAGGKEATSALMETSAKFGERSIMALALVTAPDTTPEMTSSMGEQGMVHRRLAPLGLDEVAGIAELYAGDDVASVPTESVLRASHGIPGRIHEVMSEWAGTEASRRLSAAAEYLAQGRNQRSADLRFANNVIGLKLGRLYSPEAASSSAHQELCPYKGLASFGAEDAAYFFGRERLVGELAARSVEFGILGVVGDSGSGKSSVVAAGLLPSLRAGILPGSERWTPLTMRPGEHPMSELRATSRILAPDAGTDAFEQAVRSLGGQGRLVLFVDQFEEVFTVCHDEEERTAFIGALTSAAKASPNRFLAVIAVRGDFYGQCAVYPELAELLSANSVLVGPMTPDELHRAIELPGRRVGIRVESALVDALTEEAAEGPGTLPLLSTALVELWQDHSGGWIRHEAYVRTGGIRGAVARLAEGTYEQLSPAERETARRIFLRLVGSAEGEAVTRRRVPISEFDLDRDEVARAVLDRFTEDRLLTIGAATVEVAHEALLREWPRLRTWIEEDAQGHQLRQHLTQAARHWEDSGREHSELYRGARLSATLDWTAQHDRDLNELERTFVHESRQAGEAETRRIRRTNRRLRGLLVGAAVFLIVALIAGSVAFVQRGHARSSAQAAERSAKDAGRAATEAEHSATVALSQSLGAEGVSAPRLDLALLLAAQGAKLDDSPRTQSDLLTTLTREESAAAVYPVGGNGTQASLVAVSPDGRTLAVTTSADELEFFDTTTHRMIGKPVEGISGYTGFGITFTPDGSFVIAGSDQVVDVHTQTVVRTIHGVGGSQGNALSKDGHTAYGQTPDALVRGDVQTGRKLPPIQVPGMHAFPAVASGTGEVLTLTSTNTFTPKQRDFLQLRAPGSLAVEKTIPLDYTLNLTSMAISPDATTAATSTNQVFISGGQTSAVREVHFIDLRTGEVRTGAGGLGGWSVAFSPDGRFLADDEGNEVHLWNVATAEIAKTFGGHSGPITGLAFDPSGSRLYTASADGTVIAYSLSGLEGFGHRFATGTGNLVHITKPAGQLHGYANFSAAPSGTTVATTQSGGIVNIVDVVSGNIVTSFQATKTGNADATAFSPDGQEVLVASDPGDVSLWRLGPGSPTLVRRFDGMLGGKVEQTDCGAWLPFPWATFSPDGNWVAGGDSLAVHPEKCKGERARILVWNAETGEQRAAPLELADVAITNLAYSADGSMIAAATDDPAKGVVVVDAASLKTIRTFEADPDGVNWVAFSPNGPFLATAGGSGIIRLWDTRTWKQVASVKATDGPVFTVGFDLSGNRIVAGGAGTTTSIWSTTDLHQIGPNLPAGLGTGYDFNYLMASFAAAGKWIVLVQEDGQAVAWPATLEQWEHDACSVAGRNLTADEWRLYVPDRPYQKTCPGL
jgi:WD40 repeat protein/class 3 adenylate cyclase